MTEEGVPELSQRDREVIERHIQHEIAGARRAVEHLLDTVTHWHEALVAGDPVEASQWAIQAERQFKEAAKVTQNTSLWKRQADAGLLHVDRTGRVKAGRRTE